MQKKQPQELFKLTGAAPKSQSGTFDVVLHDQVSKTAQQPRGGAALIAASNFRPTFVTSIKIQPGKYEAS
jgi:hypothetical protein